VGINAAPLAAARTGVGRYIAGLLDALEAAKPQGLRARPLFLPTAKARRLRGLVKRLPFAYPLADAARAAVLRRERPTVYHETNHAAPPFRGPVVVTVHDLSTLLYPRTQEPARVRYFSKKLRRARSAARVIVPTEAIAREVASGKLNPGEVTEESLASRLYTAPMGDLADPDLLVRTAGELRVSNFLLWQISYAEIHVTPVLWPDFGAPDLHAAVRDFASRNRKFGGVG